MQQIMVDQQTAVGSGKRVQTVGGGMLCIVAAHTSEIIVCAYHGAGIFPLSFCNKHQEGESVGQTSQQQYLPPAPAWQILVEQQQIISEIQVGFLRIPLR